MSRLDDLIQQLCPNGVEYKKVKNVYKRLRGTPITAAEMKKIATPDGEIKIFAGGKTVINAKAQDISGNNVIRVPAVLVQSRGIIDVVYYEKPFTFKNEMWAYTATEKISVRFLFYVLKNNILALRKAASGMGSLPQISLPVTEELLIPVPPLPVQEESVRILDKFTALEAELEAELEARRKQYEFYRDQLLTFGDEVEWKPLGEIGTFVRGNGLQKKDFVDHGVGCIHYGQIYTYYKTFATETKSFVTKELALHLTQVYPNDLILACTSENIEDVCKTVAWLGKETIVTGGHACVFRHKQNAKYLAYFFASGYFFTQKKKYARGAKVIDIKTDDLAKIRIPVPPLAEQERIVAILDKFDALVNDISSGLPAELEMRRKQYEYYRDRLLTFKPLAKEA